MINVMNRAEEQDKGVDPHLWAACAGGISHIPPENSLVYYFPQGHAEHALEKVDFARFPRLPPLVPCTVSSIKYLADAENDEVYAQIGFTPFTGSEIDFGIDRNGFLAFHHEVGEKTKSNSFAKTLTQSDANNGGGLSVPRYCADSIFPKLDTSIEPPVQTIVAKDVHGVSWTFRHIYRGTPRRHLLTTGWNTFINQKRLVAGDSVVFVRMEDGELRIGIRRSKKVIPFVNSTSYKAVFPDFLANTTTPTLVRRRRSVESVLESARLAATAQRFEIVYYPRAGTPEFVVPAATVRASLAVQWRSGMRLKMAFETEDSLRTSWFMGTVVSAQVHDPIHWPDSPWRFLQVSWDEPDFLNNVKRVNPWLVEVMMDPLIPEMVHLPPLLKRPRLELFPPMEFPLHLPMMFGNPLSPSSPLCCLPDNISSAGVQGSRHLAVEPSFTFDLDRSPKGEESCVKNKDSDDARPRVRAPAFVLFGQPIHTPDQVSEDAESAPRVSGSDVEDLPAMEN